MLNEANVVVVHMHVVCGTFGQRICLLHIAFLHLFLTLPLFSYIQTVIAFATLFFVFLRLFKIVNNL